MRKIGDTLRNFRWLWLAGTLPVLMLQVGCGGGDPFNRQQVSGTVMYEGQPIPRGSIWFEPDASVGRDAPTGFAVVRDGQFETQPDRSPVAGPHTLRIAGFDGSPPDDDEWDSPAEYMGEPLFAEYTTTAEIPPPDGRLELEVPSQRR